MANRKFVSAALFCLLAGSMTGSASAVTVELAKKCQGLTDKAFPPRQIGNPAAGSKKGTAQVQRDYYQKCITNDGKVDDTAPKETK